MSQQPVLIAAFSGRRLAQSMRAAGYLPLVLDSYGDEDTRTAAEHLISDPSIVENGFRAKRTLAALNALKSRTSSQPIGLVLGAGFERSPKLVARLAQEFRLLGCNAATIAKTKAPSAFFGKLTEQGIPHPKTLLKDDTTMRNPDLTWLRKRIGGMGGLHVHPLATDAPIPDGHYAQQHIDGLTISATVLSTGTQQAFAFTQQWTAPSPVAPYRFGGVVGNVSPETELETRLIDTMLPLLRDLELIGLVTFDFIITPDAEAFLLEINPRPSASLDVLDDADGSLLASHILATTGRGPEALQHLQAHWRPETKASAYLYADAGPFTIPAIAWPTWVHDRPIQGSTIAHHTPILTVTATGADPAEAVRNCQERLVHMAHVVYESKKRPEET